jgi:hypothetical protein
VAGLSLHTQAPLVAALPQFMNMIVVLALVSCGGGLLSVTFGVPGILIGAALGACFAVNSSFEDKCSTRLCTLTHSRAAQLADRGFVPTLIPHT